MFSAPPTFDELNFWAAAPVIYLAVWASVLLVADRFIRNKYIVAAYAMAGVVSALAIALFQAGDVFDIGDPGTAFEGMFAADQFTYVVNIVALISAAIGILISYEYLERTNLDRGEYYILLIFSAIGAMLMGSSNNLAMIFISLELLSIPLYILSGIRRPQEESEESAMKYFLLGAFSSSFFVYGIALVFGATGSLDLSEIVTVATNISAQESTSRFLLLLGAGLMIVGLGFKVAAVPFHMWTPDVYQGAPTPVTAYMSSIAKVGGFAAFLRVLLTGLPIIAEGGDAAIWVDTMQILAAATLILGNFVAIVQYDLKRLLAYSSIAHAGYILIALAAGGVPGVEDEAAQAALVYLAAYAFTNIGAFAVVAAIEKNDATGTTLDDLKGLANKRPWLAGAMAVFMFSLTGIPLTAGFIAKFWVFSAALEAGLEPLAILGVLTSAISAFYYVRIIWNMYFETGDPDIPAQQRFLTGGLIIAAAGTVILGILPFILENLVRDASLAILR